MRYMSLVHYRDARYRTVADILRVRSAAHPDGIAYVFLDFLAGDEIAEHSITYGELDRSARRIAAGLRAHHARGDRAILLYPPGIEYITAFFACQYAGVIAVPSYPPFTQRHVMQLLSIIGDAMPRSVLSSREVMEAVRPVVEKSLQVRAGWRWLCTQDLEGFGEPDLSGGESGISFLQYTSGSTSKPKGVMLTHENLLHNLHLIEEGFGHHKDSRGVIWLPPYHDMGLIGGILQPAYAGFPVYLLSPLSFLKKPLRWLRAITKYRATTSGGPNFAYELCIRKIPSEAKKALDLSSWDLAFNGAEPIQPSTIERFTQAFGPCGFDAKAYYPCYGLAESTLIVSGGRKGEPPRVKSFDQAALLQNKVRPPSSAGKSYVGCGGSLDHGEIVIAHPESMTACPKGSIGEIWARGPSVASGYWNNPEETERVFRAYLADTNEGPFLRTGDLGFIHEGELFITGRLKDTIILRGRNVYPQDIERTAEESHPGLRKGCNAAFAIDGQNENRVVLLQEVSSDYFVLEDLKADEICSTIRTAVAVNHGIQVHDVVLIKSNTLLKTTSGKVQRSACRTEYLSGKLATIPCGTGSQ
jgi:acyl-CoA synthetase (AMP-forming)/AMP-acid ligase II